MSKEMSNDSAASPAAPTVPTDYRNAVLDEVADLIATYDKRATPKGIATAIRCLKSAAPQPLAASAVPAIADLSHLTKTSIRDYPDFTEDVERLSKPGLAVKQAKIIRKAIYDTIDTRVRNSIIAAQMVLAAPPTPAATPAPAGSGWVFTRTMNPDSFYDEVKITRPNGTSTVLTFQEIGSAAVAKVLQELTEAICTPAATMPDGQAVTGLAAEAASLIAELRHALSEEHWQNVHSRIEHSRWPIEPSKIKALVKRAEAFNCTCPSGDGSLRHPCPQHPSAPAQQPASSEASE